MAVLENIQKSFYDSKSGNWYKQGTELNTTLPSENESDSAPSITGATDDEELVISSPPAVDVHFDCNIDIDSSQESDYEGELVRWHTYIGTSGISRKSNIATLYLMGARYSNQEK